MERRTSLKIIGAIGSTCAFPFTSAELYGQEEPAHQHGAEGVPEKSKVPYQPKFFNAVEYAAVSRIADLIIPRTDTPGALDAGVPQYMDEVTDRNPQLQKEIRAGLEWLSGEAQSEHHTGFVGISEDEQIAMLTPLSKAVDANAAKSVGEVLFKHMKSLTADGFYTSREGLVGDLGYHGNIALAEFPGCTHER